MGISVIIPAYNEEKYIGACLRSLECQDYSGNYEVIVSDGSSDDGTVRIAEKLADRRVVGVHGKLLPLDGNRFENDFCEYVLSPYSQLMVNINKPSAPGSNFAVRKKAFDRVKGFNTKLVTAEVADLCNRVKALGKFVYNPDAVVYVSTRRVREWGYLKMVSFYTSNALRYYTCGTAGKYYEAIR